jgi:hypothetical protein
VLAKRPIQSQLVAEAHHHAGHRRREIADHSLGEALGGGGLGGGIAARLQRASRGPERCIRTPAGLLQQLHHTGLDGVAKGSLAESGDDGPCQVVLGSLAAFERVHAAGSTRLTVNPPPFRLKPRYLCHSRGGFLCDGVIAFGRAAQGKFDLNTR